MSAIRCPEETVLKISSALPAFLSRKPRIKLGCLVVLAYKNIKLGRISHGARNTAVLVEFFTN